MDRPQWPQEIVVKPMEEILASNTAVPKNSIIGNSNSHSNIPKPSSSSSSLERKARPQKAAPVNCPRCESTNTKFCYYNNYSLSQPRYFCKTCRRYWTEGGTLRNIPVGGGSRKNKRSSSTTYSSSSSYSSAAKTTLPDLVLSQNPRIHHDQYRQDLNLGFLQVPNFDATRNIINTNSCVSTTTTTTTTTTATTVSALELLTGITSRGTTNSFMPIPIPISDHNSVYTPSEQLMIPMSEFKIPSLSFSLDGMGSGNSGRLLFPFEELKTNTSETHEDDDDPHVGQNKDQNCDTNGFWNGMMGGGSW